MFGRKTTYNNKFLGLYSFMCTSLLLEQLKIQNKTSSVEDFEFTRFDCA